MGNNVSSAVNALLTNDNWDFNEFCKGFLESKLKHPDDFEDADAFGEYVEQCYC